MERRNPIYIVWCPTGPYSPRVKHAEHSDALEAAQAMARRHPGEEFIVMQSQVSVRKPPDLVVDYFHDDLPF